MATQVDRRIESGLVNFVKYTPFEINKFSCLANVLQTTNRLHYKNKKNHEGGWILKSLGVKQQYKA